MKIKRTLNTSSATYDFEGVTDEEFNILFRAYEEFQFLRRQCAPSEEDSLYKKMRKLQEDRITII